MTFRYKKPAYPYVLWMAVFIIVPLLLVVYFAFTNESGGFTMKNLLETSQFGSAFVRSIVLGLAATVVCLILGYPLAFLMSRMNPASQKLIILLLMLPMWMNFLLRTYAWMTLLEDGGFINKVLGVIGIAPVKMINTQGAVVLGMVYNYLPFMVLPLYTVMLKIDRTVIEAAQDLGANSFKVLIKVLIPLSKPGILSGITMVFVPSVSTFIISRLLGGSANMLIGDWIEYQFAGGNTYNPQLGSAISLILMIFILISMALLNQFDDEETEGMII